MANSQLIVKSVIFKHFVPRQCSSLAWTRRWYCSSSDDSTPGSNPDSRDRPRGDAERKSEPAKVVDTKERASGNQKDARQRKNIKELLAKSRSTQNIQKPTKAESGIQHQARTSQQQDKPRPGRSISELLAKPGGARKLIQSKEADRQDQQGTTAGHRGEPRPEAVTWGKQKARHRGEPKPEAATWGKQKARQRGEPRPEAVTWGKPKAHTEQAVEEEVNIDPALISAATKAADAVPGNREKTVRELLQKVTAQKKKPDDLFPQNLLSLKKDLNIDPDLSSAATRIVRRTGQYRDDVRKYTWPEDSWDIRSEERGQGQREIREVPAEMRRASRDDTNRDRMHRSYRVQFLGERFNIFEPLSSAEMQQSKVTQTSFFDKLEEEQLDVQYPHLPANGFDELIAWTKQGKTWPFPVDNEFGMEEEQSVSFHEHVFLEEHLEGFPDVPSIQHFMELVCVGLSKNPFMTVKQKREHILWYKHYFEDKLKYFEDEIQGDTEVVEG